jgi:hypothetical protein
VDPPPQKKKPLTTSGGIWNTTQCEKNHFFIFLPFFACFTMCSSEAISGQTKKYFKNPREVFSHNGLKKKRLSHFLKWSYEHGESNPSSRPFFPYFHFSVTVSILQELLRLDGDEFRKTEGGFCPKHAHIQ